MIMKVELKRAFQSKGFYLSLIIGIVFSILQLKEDGFFYPFEETYFGPWSLYDYWIMFKAGSFRNSMLMLMPLLTAICYSSSFLEDRKSGFSKSIYTRINRKEYIRAKYIANFLASFVVIVIPLIIYLLFLLMTIPNIKPDVSIYNQTIRQYGMLHNLYYSQPILYILMATCIYGIFGGIYSSVSLVVSLKIKNIFVVLSTPFLFAFILDMIMHILKTYDLSPINYLSVFSRANGTVVLLEIIIGVLLTFSMFYLGGKNEEIV